MEQRAGRLPFWIETQCISWWRPIRWLGFSGLRILIDHINQAVIQPYTKANRANDLGSYRGQSIHSFWLIPKQQHWWVKLRARARATIENG